MYIVEVYNKNVFTPQLGDGCMIVRDLMGKNMGWISSLSWTHAQTYTIWKQKGRVWKKEKVSVDNTTITSWFPVVGNVFKKFTAWWIY